MKAMMSDRAGRENTASNERRLIASDIAVAEAQRILAETEPRLYTDGRIASAWVPARSGSTRAALAEALTAVLPVLDEYALDSCAPIGNSWDANAPHLMYLRNLATSAAIGSAR